ncbi:MAG TPA: hypothetical protein VGM99_01915, partial [Candidatus Cybelea sp.]
RLDRATWDLTEEMPVPWKGARAWNRGGSGAVVLPGRYTIRLHAGARSLETSLDVEADPRAPWTGADYLARYRFVRSLNDMLSAIDRALNRFGGIAAVRRLFTSGVVNSEDDQLEPDRLRERLTILQGVIALSQGPPTQAQQREAAAVCAQFEVAMKSYRAFLAARHLSPDPGEASCEQ